MAVERVYGGTSIVDVLDRILDKGLVIDVWARVSLVGIELLTVEARVVVASVDTYLRYAQAIGLTPLSARPPAEQREGQLGSATNGNGRQGGGLLQGATGQILGGVTGQLQGALDNLQGGQQGQQGQQPAPPQQQNGGGQGGGNAALADQLRQIIQQLDQQGAAA